MSLTNSILLGFIRLCLLLLFLFFMNKKMVNRSGTTNFLEFLVRQWFLYGSTIGIVIFLTVQLGIYDLMNCILILLLVIIIDFVGLQKLKSPIEFLEKKVQRNINKLIKNIELNQLRLSWFAVKRNKKAVYHGFFLLFLIAFLVSVTFISRYYFFKYDSYTLSGVWITDLEKVINFDYQIWFGTEPAVIGNLAYVNFYGKIVSISPEIALQSIGILESALLGVLLFWVIRKITNSKHLAPIVASLSFALLYTLSPINIYFLLQNKPVFLALTFALPVMVYYLKPGLLKMSVRNYFFSFQLVFIAIGLIDLFTLYILIPPFLLIAAFFTKKEFRNFYWTGVGAYIMGATTVALIYAGFCYYYETDFEIFIHSGLLSVSSYTYVPQLLVPFPNLMNYYQISTFAGILILLKFMFYNKENWNGSLVFLLYFNALVVLTFLNNPWIDVDLLTQTISVFIPIIIGINVAIVLRVFNPVFADFKRFNQLARVLCIAGILVLAVFYQKNTINKLTESAPTQREVLEAYDQIAQNYFPYTYAVVNDNSTQVMSANEHFFISYSDFIYKYPTQDSIYFKHVHDKKFLKENPKIVIPKSILLFVFKDQKKKETDSFSENSDLKPLLLDQLAVFRKRGRKVELFYDNDHLEVYEIINEAKASKISDLIF